MARSRRSTSLLLLLGLGLLLAAGLGARSCGRSTPVSEAVRNEAGGAEPEARRAAGLSKQDSSREIASVDAAGLEPHRLTVLTFVMSRAGLQVAETVIAPGRVKAPPTSVAPHQLEFSLQDAGGQVVYQGALDHPLRRVDEYEDPERPGQIKQLPRELDSEAFQLRFPLVAGARTVTLVERLTIDGQIRRRPLGTFPLP